MRVTPLLPLVLIDPVKMQLHFLCHNHAGICNFLEKINLNRILKIGYSRICACAGFVYVFLFWSTLIT